MALFRMSATLILATLAATAQAPLPEMKVLATDGGSAFEIRNTASQPLTAYLIELVNYPGSFYVLHQDDVTLEPLAAGAARRVPITNMTVGAAPEYVRMQAALYADGSSSGAPEKVTQLVERRRAVLLTTRELIGRLVKAGPANKAAVATELKTWAGTIPAPTRQNRATQAAFNDTAAKALIAETASLVESAGVEQALEILRKSERALAASKPAL